MRLCHIVPSTPPEFNGLGDYCYQLWRHWPEPRPDWSVLAARLPAGAKEFWPEAQLRTFELSLSGLATAVTESDADTVVLHYVGYAYAKRGAPGWLPSALEAWKAKTGGRLIVVFHELYATGPPWTSTFWLHFAQKSIAAKLAALADHWTTSCPRYMRVLPKHLGADLRKGTMLPIPSNIDPVREPDWGRQLGRDGKYSVIAFGLPLTRLRALRTHRNLLRQMAGAGILGRLTLAGKADEPGAVLDETESILKEIGIKWERHEDLRPHDLSRLLLEHDLGLVLNPYSILTKSGVHAAHCTHGLLSVIPREPGTEAGPFLVNDDDRPELCLNVMSHATFAPSKQLCSPLSFAGVTASFAALVPTVGVGEGFGSGRIKPK